MPSDTVFVRPDITYLKQEFSWVLPVANPGPWPQLQRFDFLVRTRPAREGEIAAAKTDRETPQRRAVLRTLQAITGQDFGDRAADWRAGLTTVVLPKENEPDLEELPREAREQMRFVVADRIEQVLDAALEPSESAASS